MSVAILAGGSGTRLWPESRRARPKQLMDLFGARSLLQATVDRVRALVPPERIYILTGPDHAEPIAAQVPDVPRANILIEPAPRGTAPCLGLAALRMAGASSPEGVMISLHADHIVEREEAFRQALVAAAETARQGYIATIGIIPTYAETGFGYIERSERLGNAAGLDVYHVARFREKPPLEVAREYAASGRHYWNTGYFAWTYERFQADLQRHLPAMYAQLRRLLAVEADGEAAGGAAAYARLWNEIESVTIDVGIMERAERVAVVPCDLGWSDVGSWDAVYDLAPKDEAGNGRLGAGRHLAVETSGSLVVTRDRLVATVGVQDLVIVDAGDAVLVLPRGRTQDVRRIVDLLREQGLEAYL